MDEKLKAAVPATPEEIAEAKRKETKPEGRISARTLSEMEARQMGARLDKDRRADEAAYLEQNKKVEEELLRLKSLEVSAGGVQTMIDNLKLYLSGRESVGAIKDIAAYPFLDRKYREFTNSEISELIRGLEKITSIK